MLTKIYAPVPQTEPDFDIATKMVEFEIGMLSREDTVRLFQKLINSGAVWSLKEKYGMLASRLLFTGECVPKQ